MRVKELIKLLADIDGYSEVYISTDKEYIRLEEEHIKPPQSFSSSKQTIIEINKEH